MNTQEIIDMYYPAGSPLRDIYLRHCRSVADLALEINSRRALGLDRRLVEDAAMLHDIGICLTDAPGIHCHGDMPYILHGVAGADLLRVEGVDERLARVAESHTGSGLTPEEITEAKIPIPASRDTMPRTLLEKLICYADKFYSKSGDMKRKSMSRVEEDMGRHGQAPLERFLELKKLFGDVE
ncbi:MAG: HDIG domain-containing protein [Muribaculaceae bacterium]|nr:HDIG domain-containing protein [Muribaculaceae bacterium]MDE6609841.1 HDIG domain-containing protein [Muribaculaceae bacterium]